MALIIIADDAPLVGDIVRYTFSHEIVFRAGANERARRVATGA